MTDPNVTAWLTRRALRLDGPVSGTADAGEGADGPRTAEGDDAGPDLTPLHTVLADARVVGVGEAAHGTRDLVALRYRMLEFLVGEMGFRMLALDVGESAATALDDHVRHATGTPGDALEGLEDWVWNTREMLTVLEMLREHNRDTVPADQVRVVGLDPQRPGLSIRVVGAFLRATVPDSVPAVADSLVELLQAGRGSRSRTRALRGAAMLRRDETALVAATSARQHAEACRHADILVRAAQLAATPGDDEEFEAAREQLAADTVLREIDRDGAAALVWAHDHVVRVRDDPGPTMGAQLRRRLGDGYYALGTLVGSGAVRTRRRRLLSTGGPVPRPIRLEPVSHGIEEQVGEATPGDHLVDLRHGDRPEAVERWLGEPAHMRTFGVEIPRAVHRLPPTPVVLGEEYDGVAYVRLSPAATAR